jgi:cytochrome b561
MTNRPDPTAFADISYILAFVSAFILLLTFGLGFVRTAFFDTLQQVIIWFALVSGGIGTFLAYAARSDFKRYSGPADAQRKARVGWRVNLATLIFMLLYVLTFVVVRVGLFGFGA